MRTKMTRELYKFLQSQKQKNIPYSKISKNIKKKFNITYSPGAIAAHFSRNGTNGTFVSGNSEQDSNVRRERILQAFYGSVSKHKAIPSFRAFCKISKIEAREVKTHFGSYSRLEQTAKERNPQIFKDIIDESVFNNDNFQALLKKIQAHRRFVVTTAVTGCAPHKAALKSVLNYCKKNNAQLLILPVSDPSSTKELQYEFSLSPDLPSDSVVFRDVQLNSNLFISTIKLSAKQINPLTGLNRLSNRGSCILASPKQMLQHFASSNKKDIPRALMTTGCITVPDYRTDLYMSERTAYLAEDDHQLGAIVVEIKNNEIFFYRRIEICQRTGSFSDLNKKYLPDGRVEKIGAELIQLPDWHVLSTDDVFREVSRSIVKKLKPKYLTLEDFFDGLSINPHEKHNVVQRALKAQAGHLSLETELKACSLEISEMSNWGAGTLVFKYGNHEDFLKRWLEAAEYSHDPVNHYEGVCLAKVLLEGEMPFEYAMRHRYPVKGRAKLKFLRINDSFKVNGIENAVHGHLGSNGKRNPGLAGLEAYGPCNTGHSHSAAIWRKVVRVGTATKLQLSYNDGASAWTQTLNIQHYDGARQLVTVINGEYCLPDILK